jgi:hypothetical protein
MLSLHLKEINFIHQEPHHHKLSFKSFFDKITARPF